MTWFLLALGLLLSTAWVLGEGCRRLRQPAVLGEILAGIVLGPTVLGALAPSWTTRLYPSCGAHADMLDGLFELALVLFLLAAGLEVDLSSIRRQIRKVLAVGLAGLLIPLGLGIAAVAAFPLLLQAPGTGRPWISMLVLGTALSVTALPVVARILRDLGLYRSDLGMVVVASAVFDDVAGWITFAVLLAALGDATGFQVGIPWLVATIVFFAVALLTLGRALIHRLLPWVLAHAEWPGGALAFVVALALLAAALSQWIGIHAVFGSFLIGVAAGDTPHLRAHTRQTLGQLVSFVFGPLFFASLGLRIDFAANLALATTLIVFVVACLGKVAGCSYAAWWSGASRREALAIGLSMNARGAMVIVLGSLALHQGLIHESMFVALVVMSLATSMMTGPLVQRVLGIGRRRTFVEHFARGGFVRRLAARSRQEAIRELAQYAAPVTGLDPETIFLATWPREQLESTGLGLGLAVPRARLDMLDRPVVVLGLSEVGIDFDAPDDKPARVIALVLASARDGGGMEELCADIARTFSHPGLVDEVLGADSFSDLLVRLNTNDLRLPIGEVPRA